MKADKPGDSQLPASFRPQLAGHFIALGAVALFLADFCWLTVKESSWVAGIVTVVLAALVAAILVDLVIWSRRGPILYVVDVLGLCKGRAGQLRQLFAWGELKAWSRHEPSEGSSHWCFETTRKKWRIHDHEVSVPSAASFELAARTASGKSCAYPDFFKDAKDAAGERFKV